MANELIEYLHGRKPRGFEPRPFYSKEGDFLTFFFEGDDHYAERLDDVLTVYRAMTDDRFVGFKLKGVVHLLETLGDFFVHVTDDEDHLMLCMLLIAGVMKTKEPSALPVYQQFARKTDKVPIRKDDLIPV
jgi:hypothetical protein